MRILFSEAQPDYAGYVFPYAIWGFPEEGDRPAAALARGFLPSLPDLSRFYLCRQIRVVLPRFRPTSENRRILRKGAGIECRIVDRCDFDWTEERRRFCFAYASRRWTSSPSIDRIDRIFQNPITTHVALFVDATGKEVGIVNLLRDGTTWFYSNAFFDPDHELRSLGAFLMTETVRQLSERGEEFLHLGTCYSRSSLYKTQFQGVEFFNGFRWSEGIEELKHLIRRQESETPGHLLEDSGYLDSWYPEGPAGIASVAGLRLPD